MVTVAGFLADTWWYGLSKRLSTEDFYSLAARRAGEGFTAIQLVVGVPPEVGPDNPNASSDAGFPWSMTGRVNGAYLTLARERIRHLNDLNLVAIVYGAWGHQIDWLGRERMLTWWRHIIETLDDLDVIYCLSGESGLWVGKSDRLLPNKTTGDVVVRSWLPNWVKAPAWLSNQLSAARRFLKSQEYAQRRANWSWVLAQVARQTQKPFIIHPIAEETGFEAVTNPSLLAVNTFHTGHNSRSRPRLWQVPEKIQRTETPHNGCINLEPWYEGILNQFWARDQLFAYWTSMLAGTISYCYGAHGIWNVGDGEFLSHWGRRSFYEAVKSETPRLIGLSHSEYTRMVCPTGKPVVRTRGNVLVELERRTVNGSVHFVPDCNRARPGLEGKFWLPLEGRYTDSWPPFGSIVVFSEEMD